MVMALRLPTVPRHRPLAAGPLSFLFLLAVALGAPAAAHAGALTLAWDASPDLSVRGYRVYVGTASGVYTETYDVAETSFVYSQAVDGTSYYFAVASVGANRLAGLPSAEVSTVALPAVSTVLSSTSDASVRRSDSRASAAQSTCERGTTPCYSSRVLAEGRGAISALAPTPDGRVFFIEDGQRIQLAGGAAAVSTALAVDPGVTTLTGLALDPAFESTGRLLVGELDRRSGAGDEMSIARYRALNDVLGERMHVTSVRTGREAGVPFTLDADGRVYVAVPSTSDDARIVAPAGAVLRFAPDGRVPDDSWRSSPLLAASVASPTALSWDRVGQKLWVSGVDGASTPTVATIDSAAIRAAASPVTAKRLSLQAGSEGASGALVAARGDVTTQSTIVWVVGSNQALYAGTVARDQTTPQLRQVPLTAAGEIVAIAVGQRGEAYVAVRAGDGAASYTVVALEPSPRVP
jgi:hypothetical protein